jgi:hypothetical protein
MAMSKLRQAAEEVSRAWRKGLSLIEFILAVHAMEEALAEDRQAKRDEYEYQLIGTIDGTYAGRWMLAALAENAAAVWPDGTAVYVRVKE